MSVPSPLPILIGCAALVGIGVIGMVVCGGIGSLFLPHDKNPQAANKSPAQQAANTSKPSPVAPTGDASSPSLPATPDDDARRLEAERQKLEAEKKAKEEQEEAERKARDEKAAADAAARIREDERRRTLESQGLAYYPSPTTVYKGKNAEEWCKYLKDPAGVTGEGLAALTALHEEGIPYLLDLLSGATDPRDHTAYLLAVKPEYVHPNDVPKLLPCLSRKWSTAARILALTDLSKRPESKAYYDQIAEAVADIKSVSDINGDVKMLLDAVKGK